MGRRARPAGAGGGQLRAARASPHGGAGRRWRRCLKSASTSPWWSANTARPRAWSRLEDVLETLLGIEIPGEGDKIEDMQQLARQLWARHAERMGIMVEGA